jgi:DNA-binding Xre family transcriptional regulator
MTLGRGDSISTSGYGQEFLEDREMKRIRLAVKEVALKSGIETPYALKEKTGLGYAICHRLWHIEVRRVDLSTLESLCNALNVKPGDLFKLEE